MKSKTLILVLFLTLFAIILSDIEENFKDTTVKERKFLYKEEPADLWFEKQRAFPFDEIPNEDRLKSIEYVKNNMSVASERGNSWSLAGPTNIEGRITAIAIHPSNPRVVYVGSANGGVWKSTNFCTSWESVFDNQNTSSIGALAIDPLNPGIIYCGTGESNSLRSYYPGTGMYKSTNAGQNWTSIGLDSAYSFGNITINPVNTQEIYTAVVGSLRRKNIERGIYKSTNGGLNWIQTLFVADSVGAIDVVIDPSNPAKVFAAMWERHRREDYIKYGGPMSALYQTTNSGANWTAVTGGFPSNDPTLGRISIDISASNTQTIYALTANAAGDSRGLYKSINGGANWTLINSGVASSSSYAWFNRICKVNPSNPDIVYCGGLEMHSSSNGGTGFGTVSTSHVDQHSVAFAPSNPSYVVVGNDGGIDYSTNGGTTWQYSNSLPITQFYAGEIDYNNPSVILGGTQDNGTNKTPDGGLNNWTRIHGGDGFYCLVDYNDPMRMYASSQFGGLARSVNGGSSFTNASAGLDLTYTNWMTPYVMDRNNPLTLYCGTYKVHKSTNGMQSWTEISPDLAGSHVGNLGTITTLDVAKSEPDVIYCGTDNANVWVTQNSGANWSLINSGLPYRWVTRVAVHPDSANVCYVTLSGYKVDSTGAHIFRTTDYGSSWTPINGNLPDAPINDVIIDPDDYNTLYAATDVGVMITNNLGANWSVLAAGIPSSVPCHDLTFHAPTRKLVIWTHGRSAFSIIIPKVGITIQNQTAESYNLKQNYPNPFNPVTNISFGLPKSSFVKLRIFDVTGRKVAVLVSEKLSAGTYNYNWNAENFPSGTYFYSLITDNFKSTRKMILLK